MKDKILEIINKDAKFIAYDEFGHPVYYGNEHKATEITNHVTKFIDWLSENAEPRVKHAWTKLNQDDHATYTTMTREEAYQYWLDNIDK